jgi:PAS domain S-box-containing protein
LLLYPSPCFYEQRSYYSQAILWLEHLKSHRNRQRDIEESEARYRALVDLGAEVGESILMAQNIGDKEGAIIFASDQFSKLTGYSNRELLAKSLFEFVSPQDREQVLSRYRRKMSGISLPGLYELHIIKKDGNQIPVEITSTVTRYQGKPTDVVYLRDITQRKNIEQQIKNSEYRLRALSRRIIDSQESERILLSRELHDQCGQELVALRLGIISLLEKYRHQDDSARLHTMINCVDNLIDTVHNLSSSLRPGMLDDLGLVNTLQWLAQDFQKRTGIECNVRLPKDQLNGIYINTDISLVAYRIVQEALTNVAKHAQASLAEISIALRKQDLRVCVTDNGIGISRKKTTGRLCLGLMGMQERASIVGGTIRIRRLHNNGTRVCFTSPLDIPAGNLLSQGEGCL